MIEISQKRLTKKNKQKVFKYYLLFFVSKDYEDGTYGVTDSVDNIEERYSLDVIKGYLISVVSIRR